MPKKGKKVSTRFAGWRDSDPGRSSEQKKYDRPIPSRELILEYLEQAQGPQNAEDIAAAFGLRKDEDVEALGFRLSAMIRDGQLLRNRRSGYGAAQRMELVAGTVVGHPEGYGWLQPDDGSESISLAERDMRAVLHGDRVLVRPVGRNRRGRLEGRIAEILERANTELVGRFHQETGVNLVVPDNSRISQDVIVAPGETMKARDGQVVVVEIVEQPTSRRQPVGRISEVLGDHFAPGMEIEIAARSHGIPTRWPEEVLRQSDTYGSTVDPASIGDRKDLRSLPLVTIDGEDARDFDDAVCCEQTSGGWRLWVAIADVAHYVAAGTALDREARKRGNSTYFPQQVIPMLPESLSNGLCSLNPDVDRLCMVAEMLFDATGKMVKSRFHNAVMHSHARLTYTEVAAILEGTDAEARGRRQAILPMLTHLFDLYRVLRKRRDKRGAIDFESQETRFLFDENRKIREVVPVVRNDAHRLIEECMIAANVAVAKYLGKHQIGCLYRIHAKPDGDKIDDLRSFLAELGLRLRGGENPSPKHFSELVELSKTREDTRLIQTVLLRSLNQAVYRPDNVGHFGLALEEYAHFTSPIRRYPDLVVHRALKHLLTKQPAQRFVHSTADLQRLGEHCSTTERRSDEAVRDAVDWLKCEFMLDKVGQEYDGMIVAVTGFGVFVQLQDVFVEGLVHITELDKDYYHFDAVKHRLVGERSGRIFRLADRIRVKVVRVDLDERNIDLTPVGDERRPKRRSR